jgi:hypothetical protein
LLGEEQEELAIGQGVDRRFLGHLLVACEEDRQAEAVQTVLQEKALGIGRRGGGSSAHQLTSPSS